MIAARPALAGKPIVIGESDPEGCAACQGPRFGYRNGTMYSSYTAASFARKHELAALPESSDVRREGKSLRISFALPRQGVSLLLVAGGR
jgi:hypothetical protein